MSINVSQIFVRYPDEKDAAGLLADFQGRTGSAPDFIVARTNGPWLAVAAMDNTPPPEAAQLLSRALEASACWFGLAGNALACRLFRYELGREVERIQEPAEIFSGAEIFPLPEYRDVEKELFQRLRLTGVPRAYLYLYADEIGALGGEGSAHDAVLVRNGTQEPFTHRVPRRETDGVRTLFDLFKEGEQRVHEMLHLRGEYDESRARLLLNTIEEICKRRTLPEGWKVRYLAGSESDPEMGPRLAALHAHGAYSYELAPPPG